MNILKGIIIGIAKIIPGLSGTILMISFNLYDKAINAITRFFDNPKSNFKFLLTLFIGVVIGIVFFSKIVSYFINNYYIYTISLFIGLILGGLSLIKKEFKITKKNILLFLLSLVFLLYLTYSNKVNVYILKNNYIDILIFIFSGFLEAIGTVLPGVSSTALLMMIGIYPYYIEILGNLFNLNKLISSIYFLLPFSVGLILGIIIISLLVNYLFKYHKENTFAIIFGVSISSIITLLSSIIFKIPNILTLLTSISLILIGYLITNITSN